MWGYAKMIEQESQSGEERRKRYNEEEKYKSVLEIAGFFLIFLPDIVAVGKL